MLLASVDAFGFANLNFVSTFVIEIVHCNFYYLLLSKDAIVCTRNACSATSEMTN